MDFKNSPLVSAGWLYDHLNDSQIIILDATIPKATDKVAEPTQKQIKGARRFDIKNIFSDQSATYPNTMLSSTDFEELVQNLGINKDHHIVVYDIYGIYSSARAWWMFKSMGHHKVSVLNGGLPVWESNNYPLEQIQQQAYKKSNFKANFSPSVFKSSSDVERAIDNAECIIDARSELRFNGLVDEPRPGLRSGHIPTSLNLPFTDLLVDGKMREKHELISFFKNIDSPIFTCGSGVTACILALSYEIIGGKNASVYDGSWTEWGSTLELPIEK